MRTVLAPANSCSILHDAMVTQSSLAGRQTECGVRIHGRDSLKPFRARAPSVCRRASLKPSYKRASTSPKTAVSEAHPGDATASLTAEGLAPRRGNRLKDESGGDLGDTLRHDWVGVDVRAAALLRRSARLRPRRMLRCRDAALQYSTLHEAGPDWRDLPTIQCASKSHVLVPIPWRHPEAEQQHLHAVLSVCGVKPVLSL
ncbi:hypothetical protein MRX96_058392 [Rhipicephalus microplus]